MKRASSIQAVKREIDSYEKHFTGAPLVVGIDAGEDYVALLSLLRDDYGKQLIRMSDACAADLPPDPAFQITRVSNAAREKPVIWLGAAQAKMLYGQQPTERFIIGLLGTSLAGPVAVLCPYCCNLLEGIARNYVKLGHHVLVKGNGERNMPTIHVSTEDAAYPGADTVKGIRALLTVLEDGKCARDIHLATSCSFSYLSASMYPVSREQSPYRLLCRMEPAIAANTREGNGTAEQWARLLHKLQDAGGLSELCAEKVGAVGDLPNAFGDHLSGEPYERFLCFLCLKVFYGIGHDYLAYCLRKAETADALERAVYTAILDIEPADPRFSPWLRQRRRMLSSMDDNSAMMKDYCALATVKGKDILWYLSDETEEERAALIHALCSYPYDPDELERILPAVSPQLAAYLQPFVFDESNTKLMESDADIRGLLTAYFQRYKLQKLTDHLDKDFVALVETEAVRRSFTKLQGRSAILKKLDKKDVRPYFFDALGAEFLSFIRSRADAYGMQFGCAVACCNLPSITSKNKEFYDVFPEGSVLKEEGLDEIKHHGTKYDFRFTPEPLHIFAELDLLDRDLKKMGSMLAREPGQKIVIVSDHGASRLAVTYRSENDKLSLAEPGRHSGRCCPVSADPHIDFAIYEGGFASLANYERFKGSRRADVEAHGGATLEETVVPVITLTLKPRGRQLFFVESVVTCSPRDGTHIRLFANPPLKAPRMVIGERSYEGKFDGDEHIALFQMPDIKRKGQHAAKICDGDAELTELSFETRRQTGTNQLF